MSERKKLCILLPSHYSSNLGGAEYQAKLLVERLSKNNKLKVFYLCLNSDINYVPKNYEIRTLKENQITKTFGSISYAPLIYSALKKIKPDIIYQNVGGVQTGIAALYAKKNGVRFVWHVASDDDIVPQWRSNYIRTLRFLPDRLFLNFGIRNSGIIAAQTRYQASLLKNKFNKECQNFIPIGHPLPENKIIKDKKITILWIANLKPLKQPELFVKLAKKFSERSDVYFRMVGSPGWGNWFKEILEDINELTNIDYLGQLNQIDVNRHLEKSHILVNTSRYEGFSNTFVQAWMREVPVVSLNVDPDNILVNEHIGLRSLSFDQLCIDVDFLVTNSDFRERMGARASLFAKNHHSVEKMIDSAIKLIE